MPGFEFIKKLQVGNTLSDISQSNFNGLYLYTNFM